MPGIYGGVEMISSMFRKQLLCFLLIHVWAGSSAQLQFIGFDRNVCPTPMSNTYTYTNFSTGGGSGASVGFTVYKNGTAVYTISGQMGDSKTCHELLFVNDSTGFLVYYSGNTGSRLMRSTDYGQSWSDIGGGAPLYFGVYVLNPDFVYLVTAWNIPNQVYVAKCSSNPQFMNSTFIVDQLLSADLFANDTVINTDLCGLDSLQIRIQSGIDTVCYHIHYTGVLASVNQPDSDEMGQLYPNPAQSQFRIGSSLMHLREVTLFSTDGTEVRRYDRSSMDQNQFSLHGVENGIYLLRMNDAGRCVYRKLMVLN